jgi:hypothetical protein
MSATFPADVFDYDRDRLTYIADLTFGKGMQRVGCYVSMNREPGATASLETVHECGLNDWACPVGVALELAQGEWDVDIPNVITYDDHSWTIVSGPNEVGYYHLNRTERISTGTCGHAVHVYGETLGLPTL